jgi:3-phosphoshikimate 1-carboxyvinyltransferase
LFEVFESFGLISTVKDGLLSVEAGGKCVDRFDLDVRDIPDMFPALCATVVAMQIPAQFTGVKNLRDKESDRIAAMQAASVGLGAEFTMLNEDALKITYTGRRDKTLAIETAGDHRIAMACAVYAYCAEVTMDDEIVVKKSFAGFWESYARLHGNLAKEITK